MPPGARRGPLRGRRAAPPARAAGGFAGRLRRAAAAARRLRGSGRFAPPAVGGGAGARGAGGPGGGGFGNSISSEVLSYVKAHGGGTIAVSSQSSAAGSIISSGADVAGIGGFSGRESSVSVSWLAEAVRDGKIRWVLDEEGSGTGTPLRAGRCPLGAAVFGSGSAGAAQPPFGSGWAGTGSGAERDRRRARPRGFGGRARRRAPRLPQGDRRSRESLRARERRREPDLLRIILEHALRLPGPRRGARSRRFLATSEINIGERAGNSCVMVLSEDANSVLELPGCTEEVPGPRKDIPGARLIRPSRAATFAGFWDSIGVEDCLSV